MSFARIPPAIAAIRPEIALGGFSKYDGTIEFYSRVKALAEPDMVVVDFGAGRGAWFEDEESPFRRDMRLMKGTVREVIGCDVDGAVRLNRAIDRALVLERDRPLPLPDASISMVVADYVFEHIDNTAWLATELDRILKPGGWICARTPTKYNYVSLFARLVPNFRHSKVLSVAQPGRKAEDVFPTVYKLNTRADVAEVFAPTRFEDHSYIYGFDPQYYFGKVAIYRVLAFLHWLLPASLHGNLYIFLRKRKGLAARPEAP